MAFRSKVTQVRNGQATRPNVPEAWRQDQDGEPEKEEEDQGQITSSDAAASDENLAPMSKPWEWDFTNKRRFKLTTKQLRRMFSPRSERRRAKKCPSQEFETRHSFERGLPGSSRGTTLPARGEARRGPPPTSPLRTLTMRNSAALPARTGAGAGHRALALRLPQLHDPRAQEACLRGDLGLVKRLISARASVNAPMRPQDAPEFMTLLHVLARKPHMQNCSSIIAEMVRNKANLNVRTLGRSGDAWKTEDDVQNPPAFARRSVGAVVPWSRMSKALERVQSALKADQQRHQQRQRGGKVPTQELSLLDDVELPKKHRFRDLVLRILTVNRSLKLGIQRSNLKEWHELSKFRRGDEPIDSEEFLKMIAIKLHEAKVSTAHLCWHEFVKPLRDPLEGLADLRYFYEPLHSLEPTEQEFMVNLIREVLRMMMDSTDGKQKISSSVLERFVSEVHENEVKALKDEVTQKNWQLKQMKQAQNFLETQLLKNTQSPNERTAGSLEKMLQVTEARLSHVRGAFYDLQKDQGSSSFRSCEKEMAERLEQEMSENGLLQSEIARLCSVEEDQKQMIQSLETEHIELKETIKEQQVRLERTLARLMRRAANAEAAASHCESGAAAGAVEGAVEGALLREHCVQLSLLPAQQMQEEANQLITTAESLGCQVEAVNAQVRLCRCGNVLMDDARFCRKCGGQWTPGEAGGASSQQLAAEVSSLRMKIQESEQVLREFTKESGASTGTESSFTMSRIFRPKDGAMLQVEEISQEELQQRDELLRQRTRLSSRHLEELKQGKLLAEAKLLAQRCMDLSKESGVDVMAALDEEALTCFGCDGVNCQYRRQVEVLQEMVKTLRGLCDQLSERLQQATGEHLQMSMALTSMQGSLEAAAQAVEQTSQERVGGARSGQWSATESTLQYSSCFIRPGGVNKKRFSAEPGNLMGLHSMQFSGLANDKALDIRPKKVGKKQSIELVQKPAKVDNFVFKSDKLCRDNVCMIV
eukprot:g13578.t1